MTRLPFWAVTSGLIAVLGVAGLARGAVPQAPVSGGAADNSPPIVVSGAYVRQPASPDLAAAYFTVYNTTATPNTLTSAESGAGQESVLHEESNGSMTITPNGVVIPAHGSVTFKPTTGHVMIEGLYGKLLPGQTVDLELDFSNSSPVIVEAPVIGIYAQAPTGPAATSGASSSAPSTSTGAPK